MRTSSWLTSFCDFPLFLYRKQRVFVLPKTGEQRSLRGLEKSSKLGTRTFTITGKIPLLTEDVGKSMFSSNTAISFILGTPES